MAHIDHAEAIEHLSGASPEEIIRWAIGVGGDRTIVSTHFGPYEAAILHLCASAWPEIPVVWVDTGYNTEYTYDFAKLLTARLGLNLKVYTPTMSPMQREELKGSVDPFDEESVQALAEEVKLEPFRRALSDLCPAVWLTAIRREQTPFRQTLDVVSQVPGGPLKVAPFFHLTESDMARLLREHDLPDERRYYDPTKVLRNRECGLHPRLDVRAGDARETRYLQSLRARGLQA